MSKILCIIDGMSDASFCPEAYPSLASFPERTFINTIPEGFEPETLPCVLSLLGIKSPPRDIRGWIEALGAGIDVAADDLIFRGTWVEVDADGVCVGFCNAPDGIPKLGRARYESLGGYKSLLILPGLASCAETIKLPLPSELIGRRGAGCGYENIALLRNALARINGVASNRIMIPWAAASVKKLPSISQSPIVCGTNVVKGIAKALGMKLVTDIRMTGDTDTDLQLKRNATLALAGKYPSVTLHIGGCDEAAHRMNKAEKTEFLFRVDEIVLSRLLASEHEIEVVSDHGCDSLTGCHIGGNQQMFRRR